jgi:hypothetical protein
VLNATSASYFIQDDGFRKLIIRQTFSLSTSGAISTDADSTKLARAHSEKNCG